MFNNDIGMNIPEINNVHNAYSTLMDAINNYGQNGKWPVTNNMWRHVQYGSLVDYLNHISDCAVPFGFHDHELVTEYYYRCEYRSYETRGYITEGNKWYSSEMLTERLRKDPWGRNFICFPYHTDSRHTVNGLTYKFERIYKHNRTAIVGYLISTSIDRKIIWCVDMFKNVVI